MTTISSEKYNKSVIVSIPYITALAVQKRTYTRTIDFLFKPGTRQQFSSSYNVEQHPAYMYCNNQQQDTSRASCRPPRCTARGRRARVPGPGISPTGEVSAGGRRRRQARCQARALFARRRPKTESCHRTVRPARYGGRSPDDGIDSPWCGCAMPGRGRYRRTSTVCWFIYRRCT